jgi:hypothetical protein
MARSLEEAADRAPCDSDYEKNDDDGSDEWRVAVDEVRERRQFWFVVFRHDGSFFYLCGRFQFSELRTT